jgi:ATP-dependent Lhr-like helicase
MAELEAHGRVAHLDLPTHGLWLAAERRGLLEAVHPEGSLRASTPPGALPAQAWSREAALVELVRGRLTGLGPVSAAALAQSLGAPGGEVDTALLALQSEGFAMRGRFTPDAHADEWCERRLLARIHRYTVKRLRAEIEPVQARELLSFLMDWQRVAPHARMQGPEAVAAVLGQLEGFEAPAGSWESELLPARLADYEPAWLDEHGLAGRFAWTRLGARSADSERGAGPVRTTPIALIARRALRCWSAFAESADAGHLTANAAAVSEYLREQGASFFDEITDGTRLLATQVEEALGELVAHGVANSDSFSGLRALLVPADRRRRASGGRRRRPAALFGMSDSGRWALVRRIPPAERGEAVEHVVRTLLKRWGVILWRVLAREAGWLPPWRELLMCCRRLEARGELRGGRFVTGFSGEQYATPEAIGLLREVRRRGPTGEDIALSAADPLNLVGLLTPGARLPALTGNRVLYRDGIPLAVLSGGETQFLQPLAGKERWDAQNALIRRASVPMTEAADARA